MGPSDAVNIAICHRLSSLPPTEENKRVVELYNLDVAMRNYTWGNALVIALAWSCGLMFVAVAIEQKVFQSNRFSLVELAISALVFVAIATRNLIVFKQKRLAAKQNLRQLLATEEYEQARLSLNKLYRSCHPW